jgi:6-pyruvoyltetrahydropterin/6-carboxytetrahydropterin synthase
MFRLTREVRFAINDAWPDPQLSNKPTNGYGGYPSFAAIESRFYTLAVTLEGELDPGTGYLRNIKEIDEAVRTRAIELVATGKAGFKLPLLLTDRLKDAWPEGKLHSLRLGLTPFLSVAAYTSEHPMIRLSQKFEFSASHRLHSAKLSDEENRRCFGKCNNPHGHGHNYEVEVTLTGDPIACGGTIIAIPEFERIVGSTVIDRFDHKNLNVEVPEFNEVMPSVENIAKVIFDLLKPKFSDQAKLSAVTVWETPKTWCQYS